jgi:pimeloyl-ACP methyl ester carboxylesterase
MTAQGPTTPYTSTETARGTDRRTFLASVGALATVLIAGCSGDEDASDPSPTPTTDESPDPTETPEPTATETPGPDPTETQTPEQTPSPAEIEADPATLERRAREFLRLQSEGSFSAAHDRFIESTATDFSVTQMSETWQQIVSTSGEFESFAESEHQDTRDGVAVVTVETVFANAQSTFQVVLTADGVQGYQIIAQETYDWEAPEYADTSAFTETTVTLDATESCELGGTLSLPAGEEQVPGVVIVHGSGPVDRDATFGPNKPYKELAWGLASHGIAVLRYDKRTNACNVDLSGVTIDDVTTDDALTATERLRAHDRVAPDSVFVVGHSLGGALAPRIAGRDGRLAGAVMLAPGPARPMAETILDQERYLIDQQDLTEEQRAEALAEARTKSEKIRTLDIGDDEVLLGLGGREYFQSLAEYDGPAAATDLAIPLFVGQGQRDYQVTPDEDLPVWRDALSGQSDVRLEVYEGLNHVFQDGTGPSTGTEYFDPEAVFDRRVVEDIVGFVEANT